MERLATIWRGARHAGRGCLRGRRQRATMPPCRLLPRDCQAIGYKDGQTTVDRGEDGRQCGPSDRDGPSRSAGLERAGLLGLKAPRLTVVLILVLSALAAWGVTRLKVDNSLSELFRTDTEEFRRYEEIDRRFPSSEYDVLVVVEGKDLLKKPQIEAFRRAIVDLQLADGVDGLVSMLSARGKPDASGYAPPIVPDDLPDGPGLRRDHQGAAVQRDRHGQVPVARRRAGAGRDGARPQGGAGARRQGGDRQPAQTV